LTSLFPMRTAREVSGLAAEGERLTVFRSPPSIRDNCEVDLSFGDWGSTDPLPDFENAMEAVFDRSPPPGTLVHPPAASGDLPSRFPDHPDFPPSGVSIPIVAIPMGPVSQPLGHVSGEKTESLELGPVSQPLGHDSGEKAESLELHPRAPWMLEGDPRTDAEADADWKKATNDLFPSPPHTHNKSPPFVATQDDNPSRRRVNQRWYYEPHDDASDHSELIPPLGKRISKIPQRLTHTRLGMLISSAAISGDKSSNCPAAVSSPSSSVSSATTDIASSTYTHGQETKILLFRILFLPGHIQLIMGERKVMLASLFA
jgi:hypothetical protein